MKTHELKIDKEYYWAIVEGYKNFELRKNDRNYQIGDFLLLNEYKNGMITGRSIKKQIIYILENCSEYGLQDGYCILGLNNAL